MTGQNIYPICKILKHCILLTFLFAIYNPSYSNQDKRIADSLLNELINNRNLSPNKIPELYKQGIEYAEKSGDKNLLGDYFYNLGVYYHKTGGYPLSYNNLISALKIYESVNNNNKTAQTYRILGESNRATANFELSLIYLNKAVSLFRKLRDTSGILSTYNRKAAVFYEQKNFDSLVYYAELSNKLAKIKGNENRIMANNYNILGAFNMDTKPEIALDYFKKALSIIKDDDLEGDKANILINIAILNYDKGNYIEAKDYGIEAYKIGADNGILQYIIGSARMLAQIFEKLEDYQQAYYYKNKYSLARDSVIDAKKSLHIYDLQRKFEDDKLQQQIKYQDDINFYKIFGLISISLIFLVFSLFLYSRQKELSRKNKDLEQKNNIINKQAEELSTINNNKDLLFSIVAHDLKNPLSSMQMIAKMFVDEYFQLTDDEKVDFINDIIKASSSANLLLESLLVWSRSQRNLIDVSLEVTNPHEVIENIGYIIQSDMKKKSIELINNIPYDFDFVTDVNMFSTIFRNLISNAVKFTPKYGTIEVGIKEITSSANGVEFFVSDTGIGMSNDEINNLFKPGKRNMTVGTDNEQGSGLGLLICMDFCKKLNGSITVESQEEVGSTFRVYLQTQKLPAYEYPLY